MIQTPRFTKHIQLSDYCNEIQPIVSNNDEIIYSSTINESNDTIQLFGAIWYLNRSSGKNSIEFFDNDVYEITFNPKDEQIIYACLVKSEHYQSTFETFDEFKSFINYIDNQFMYWKLYYHDNIRPNQIIVYDLPFIDPTKSTMNFELMNQLINSIYVPRTLLNSVIVCSRLSINRLLN